MDKQDALAGEIISIAQELGIVGEDEQLDKMQVLMLTEVIKVKIKATAAALEQASERNAELVAALRMGYELSEYTESITLRLAMDDTVATLLIELRNRIDKFQQTALPALERVHATDMPSDQG